MLSKQEMWEKLGSTSRPAERTGSIQLQLLSHISMLQTAVSKFISQRRRRHYVWELNGGGADNSSKHEAGVQQGVLGAPPRLPPEGLCPGGPHRAVGVPAGVSDHVLTCQVDGSI